MAEPSLFERASVPVALKPLVVLSNRYNLLEFISSGMIECKEGISKYYQDLLSLSPPGVIPVLRAPISAEVAALANSESETAFPVAIALDSKALTTRKLPAICATGEAAMLSIGDEDGIGWLGAGAIPLAAVTAVYFRSKEELEEHRAREYANVATDALPLKIDPLLFEGGALGVDSLRQWLVGSAIQTGVTSEGFDRADRLRGARYLALLTSPGRSVWLRGVLDAIRPKSLSNTDISGTGGVTISGVKKIGGKKGQIRKGGPSPASLTADGAPLWFLRGLEGMAHEAQPARDIETRMFAAALAVFSNTRREARWRPLEVVSAIEVRLSGQSMSLESDDLAKSLESIRAILRNDREFRPFKPGKGLSAAKALLMALLRPDITRLLSWSREQSGADDASWSAAATLVGALGGFRTLPTRIRHRGMDRYFERLVTLELRPGTECDWIDAPPENELDVSVAENITSGAARIIAEWHGQTILAIDKAPVTLTERLLGIDASSEAGALALYGVAKLMEWTDCIRTTIRLAGPEFAVSGVGKSRALTITVEGEAEVSATINSEWFLTRLKKEGIPLDREGEVVALLERPLGCL
jgi:hypothetical protein